MHVPGEADLVAVIAEAAPAVEDQRPVQALPLHVGEEDVVQPPGGVEARDRGVAPLLPVQPPEVHALPLEGVDHVGEVRLREVLVLDLERHVLLGGRIDPHRPRHRRILRLVRLDAGGRVQVHRRVQPLLVDPAEERVGIREVGAVPGVAGPAQPLPRLVLGLALPAQLEGVVPVHVDDQHVQRHVVAVEVLDQLLLLRVGVRPVARPPGAEGEARRHRDLPGHAREVRERAAVVVAVAEEVPVLPLPRCALHHPRPRARVEQRALRVVHQRPAVAREQALLERHRAARAVERAGRASQVRRIRRPGPPRHRGVRVLERDAQVLRSEPAAARDGSGAAAPGSRSPASRARLAS